MYVNWQLLKRLTPYFICLVIVGILLQIHMSREVDSMLNERNTIISNGFLTSQINYHKTFAPFARRPMTSALIETTANSFNISLGKAFIWVNFTLLFISGVLLYYLSRILNQSRLYSNLNIIFYFLTFSLLFAFFPPIFTYDEPLQYCFVFMSLIAFFKQKWVAYICFFTLAMIARESSIFLLPGLGLFPQIHNHNGPSLFSTTHLKRLVILFFPVVLYAAFIFFFLQKNALWGGTMDEMTSRFSCFSENFRNRQNSVETVASLLMTLGPFAYFLVLYFKNNSPYLLEKKLARAFLLTCAINTVIVITATFAREARLFALPLFFVWPVFSAIFWKEVEPIASLRLLREFLRRWPYLIIFLFATFINYLISFKIYEPNFPGKDNYFNEYLFCITFVLSFHFILRRLNGKLRLGEEANG